MEAGILDPGLRIGIYKLENHETKTIVLALFFCTYCRLVLFEIR